MPFYKSQSNQELLNLLKSGDESALNEIYKRYYGILYSHAYKRFPDREEVRDIVQEVFINLWNNREHVCEIKNLPSYLYASVRNRILNVFRNQKVRESFTSSLQDFIDKGENITEEKVREKELILLVEQEITALPSQMRLIFEMSRNLEMSHKQIAQELDLSPHTVRTQVRNALRILRVKLETYLVSIIFLIFF